MSGLGTWPPRKPEPIRALPFKANVEIFLKILQGSINLSQVYIGKGVVLSDKEPEAVCKCPSLIGHDPTE